MPVERIDPPLISDEQAMLVAWLDWQRATLAQKCEDLAPEQLAERSVPPSSLSLLGLLQHMVEVERSWFRRAFGEEVEPVYYSDADPDGDFDTIDPARAGEVRAAWEAECVRSRATVAAAASLDVTGRLRSGDPVSLRWILVHMIEEYARHNGHADFLRERIDGRTGD